MKTQVTAIAENRMKQIAENSSLSLAPARNSELMNFMQNNPQYSVLEVMKFYVKEIKRISYEIFKSNPETAV